MNLCYEKLTQCLESLKEKTSFEPKVALVLGSGLGDYAEKIEVKEVVDYHDIEGFPVSTVPGHKGRFIFGYVGEVPVVIMQGRVHYYEGYSMTDVVLPIRLMKLMGAETILLTNAAGGINENFHAGDLMIIKDHIATGVPNPLIGENFEKLGVRFPDMTNLYDEKARKMIKTEAAKLDIPIQEGVYVQLTGPSYETPAEIKMCRILGGDAVGMSTACEAIAARHMGMKVCGISCITNMAAGISGQQLDHKEVQETADRVSQRFQALVTNVIQNL